MRSWNVNALFCATCIVGATACSGEDPSTADGALTPSFSAAGTVGSAGRGGGAGAGGAGAGGSAADDEWIT